MGRIVRKAGGPSRQLTPMETVFAAGGASGQLMRQVEWASTRVGPPDTWPQSLRSAVSICLLSRFPMVAWWGPELVFVFNDGYRPLLGVKDPAKVMGQTGRDVWPEIWEFIGPMLQGVLTKGDSTLSEDQLLYLDRNGYLEECYFTFSFSPMHDESGAIGGIFTAVVENTQRVIGTRRLRTLNKLSEVLYGGHTAEEICAGAARAMAQNPADIPFAALYMVDSGRSEAALMASTDLLETVPPLPDTLGVGRDSDPTWRLSDVFESGGVQQIEFSEGAGAADGRPRTALIVPIPQPGHASPVGVMVVGVSPRRALDADYQGFFELVAGQIGSAIADAKAYEAERRRAEALAELDRAKTAFFSNVSHEFRTPLTLLLGPLEQALERLPADQRGEIEIAHRNAMRLLRLVNTLLDFSRIEAGRIEAMYEPVDFSRLNAELASSFRSVVETAGLELVVDCPPLAEPAYLDVEMWEKVVLNLVSNAFKFTLQGRICVQSRLAGGGFELTVSDTGVGIADEDKGRIFDRFYRIRGTESRTHEGTGIGLALVRELVSLQGGEIQVESSVGKGTAFTIAIPRGTNHLPADRVGAGPARASTDVVSAPFVEEAGRWLPGGASIGNDPTWATEDGSHRLVGTGASAAARVLVVDDNADMRDYLLALLAPHWNVEAVPDGAAALRSIEAAPPDLVLSDVMMPVLDGFQLVAALRSKDETRHIPVVLLSARAGDEATVVGLEAGADDYVVKPFVARELVARVRANLELSRMRLVTRATIAEADRLQAEIDRAAELEKTKSEFLRLASHELRGPLTVLSGYLALIKNGTLGDISPELVPVIPVLEIKLRDMTTLVEQMLEAARLEDNKLALSRERLDLRDVVTSVIEAMTALVPATHSLTFTLAARPVWVDGDPKLLGTVLSNLVDNAIRYSPEGGAVDVHCGERVRTKQAVIEVHDEGLGIADTDLPRLFTRFGRIVTPANSNISGTGLGLYLSRELARMHGGTISFSRRPRGGSTFTLILPLGVDTHGDDAGRPGDAPAGRGARTARTRSATR